MKKQLINLLIDGNNLAHRCKHVFSLSDAKGIDVSVTYGFLRVLASLMTKYKANTVTVCWDYGIPNYRRQTLPEYKANRHHDEDPAEFENFIRQINELYDYVLPMLGILTVRKYGAEADDLLYHASRLLTTGTNIIVSGDMDMMQAINDNTWLHMPSRDTLYSADVFEAEYGIPIEQYLYWRALQGDGSDNIAGVTGIGAKTATKLFQEWKEISVIFITQ